MIQTVENAFLWISKCDIANSKQKRFKIYFVWLASALIGILVSIYACEKIKDYKIWQHFKNTYYDNQYY